MTSSRRKIIKRTIVRTDSLMNRSYEINSKEDIDKYVEELKEKLLKEFEKNVVYDITLDTYKTFDTRICVVEHNNKLEIREPEPGETTCK